MNPELYQELVRQISSLQKQIDALVKLEVGRWVDWTPAIDQAGAVAHTVTYARYMVDNNGKVTVICKLSITGTGTAGNAIIVSGIPVSAKYFGDSVCPGSATIKDTSAAFFNCGVEMTSATTCRFLGYNVPNYFGIVPSFGLANGDIISFTIIYERA